MSVFGWHRLIPPNLLAGRWIVVLVCYLDDSGKDPQNPVSTIAGYVAREAAWAAFESEGESWFSEYGVNILHAKDLQDTDGEFSGWPVLKKQAFVREYAEPAPHI